MAYSITSAEYLTCETSVRFSKRNLLPSQSGNSHNSVFLPTSSAIRFHEQSWQCSSIRPSKSAQNLKNGLTKMNSCAKVIFRDSFPFSLVKPRRKLDLQRGRLVAKAAVVPDDGQKWWEKNAPANMKDLHSTQEFVEALSNGGDNLVVVEFYATWCGSCKALYPKLCKLADANKKIQFFKVNFDENKPMCKSLNIKVLPFFHFYRGAEGRVDAFSASISKLQKLKDALEIHSTDRCSLGAPPAIPEVELLLENSS